MKQFAILMMILISCALSGGCGDAPQTTALVEEQPAAADDDCCPAEPLASVAEAEECSTDDDCCPAEPTSPATTETAGCSAEGDWCTGHGLPESMCTKCNPSLIAEFEASGDWCAGHGFPESACPFCNPRTAPSGARTVRLASPDIEEAAGIATVPARLRETAPGVDCPARIAFDGDRVADVRTTVPGLVRRVLVGLGDTVRHGAPLFELESARVGEVQGALLSAREEVSAAETHLQRLRDLRRDDVASARQVEIAGQELAAARARAETAETMLRLAGAPRASTAGGCTVTAPLGGTVVERPAMVGQLAAETTSLATIADTSVMWAICHVPETDAARIAMGQRARLTVDGTGLETEGEITWIAAVVDPRTRTVMTRVELPNPDGRLRANQFARVLIETGPGISAVTVPRDAIQRVGADEVVFVRLERGVYEARSVRRLGGDSPVRIDGAVRDGDRVVTTGAVFLRTEMMPGSIGAGCCDAGPLGGE